MVLVKETDLEDMIQPKDGSRNSMDESSCKQELSQSPDE